MIITGIHVGDRSAFTAKRDGTVIWNPPLIIDPHTYPWEPKTAQNPGANNRVMIPATSEQVHLRGSYILPPEPSPLANVYATVHLTRQRGTVLEGPVYNADPGNLKWWYRVGWDDPSLPNLFLNGLHYQGCWVKAEDLVLVVENRTPVADNQAVVTTVGDSVPITLVAADADGDDLTYSVSAPTKGTLSGTAPELTYTSTDPGLDVFDFTVSDGERTSNVGIVSITNNPVAPPGDDVPVILSRNGWTVYAFSSQETVGENAPATRAIDGLTSTFWHSKWTSPAAAPPHTLTINLGDTHNVMGVRYLPRQDGGTNGLITAYEIHVSANASDWTLAASGTWPANDLQKAADFPKVPARFVRLTSTGDTFASAADLQVLIPQAEVVEPPPEDPGDTPPPSGTISVSSITQHGITWTFAEKVLAGQYCNGDWWVIGPIVLTGPVSTSGMNGTMINPVPSFAPLQGFDSRMTARPYSPSLNVGLQLPKTVYPGASVISSISHPVVRSSAQLDYQAVLTVVAKAPPVGSFRPSYFNAVDKDVTWNKADIDYSKLQNLPVLVQADRAYAEELLEMPMFNLGGVYNSETTIAYYNAPIHGKAYGREIILGIARVGLELNFNYTRSQKELMAIRMIQQGLDIYGGNIQGLKFVANGGHQGGRKLAMAMAGLLLNDNDILARCDGIAYPDYFPEDTQHFYVAQRDVDLVPREAPHPLYPTLGPFPYTSEHLGMPEWGPVGGYPKNSAGSNWSRPYRNTVCPNFVGEMLAAKLSGLEAAWNRPAFFNYTFNRAYPNYLSEGKLDSFIKAMCVAYANQAFGATPNNPSQWPR